jgi:hypothetical protein
MILLFTGEKSNGRHSDLKHFKVFKSSKSNAVNYTSYFVSKAGESQLRAPGQNGDL